MEIRIAICDDEKIFFEKLKYIISEYMQEHQLFFDIDTYDSGVAFSNLGPEMAKYQIVFLDIDMDEQDGIETARKLREYCGNTYIVFVTAHISYTLEGYKVEAIRYILKNTPTFKETVFESLDTICNKMNYVADIKCFNFKEGRKTISIKRISYIESHLHKVCFHVLETDYVEYNLYDTLNNIENTLSSYNFIRLHQSFLVNPRFIANVANYRVHLVDGTTLNASKSRFKDVKEKFAKFKGEFE